jgi:hypothetical protein
MVVRCFELLVKNKLLLLAREVAAARRDFVISQGEAQKLISQAHNAASKLAAGNHNVKLSFMSAASERRLQSPFILRPFQRPIFRKKTTTGAMKRAC